MKYIFIILMGYLFGCSSMSYYISKIKKIDLRNLGSKNLGASNTVALIGWKEGILVAVHDALKAMISVIIARYCFSDCLYGQYVAGVSSVLGHIYPFYLHFKGGKGTASFIGMILALDPLFGIVTLALLLIIMVVSDYIVLGTFSAITIVPLYIFIKTHDFIAMGIILIASLVILYKHRENIVNLKNGSEMGLRKANKGQYRK